MRLVYCLPVLAGALFLSLAPAFAQDALFPAFDLRAQLLGGTGLNATGVDALWTNPAGLATAEQRFAGSATAEQRFGLSELTLATVGAAYGTGTSGFGLQLASFGLPGYRENRFGLAYGRALSPKLSVGGDLAAFGSVTEGYGSTFAVTFGLGAQLTLHPQLRVAARIFSPLRRERLPDEYLPQLLALGLQYRPSEQLRINAEFHQDTDHPGRFRAGVEYLPSEALSIRVGVATAASELSFGLGYQVLERLHFGAGARWHEVLGVWPVAGLRWQ